MQGVPTFTAAVPALVFNLSRELDEVTLAEGRPLPRRFSEAKLAIYAPISAMILLPCNWFSLWAQ